MKQAQVEFGLKSGNFCTVTVKAPHGVLLPLECLWEQYPPTTEDVVMVNRAIGDWLRAIGIKVMKGQLNVIDDQHSTDEVAALWPG